MDQYYVAVVPATGRPYFIGPFSDVDLANDQANIKNGNGFHDHAVVVGRRGDGTDDSIITRR